MQLYRKNTIKDTSKACEAHVEMKQNMNMKRWMYLGITAHELEEKYCLLCVFKGEKATQVTGEWVHHILYETASLSESKSGILLVNYRHNENTNFTFLWQNKNHTLLSKLFVDGCRRNRSQSDIGCFKPHSKSLQPEDFRREEEAAAMRTWWLLIFS